MALLTLTDIDFDSVARVKNALDALDPQDYVTLAQLLKSDYHSGVSSVPTGDVLLVRENKQMLNFITLTLDGELLLEGDLCLA